MADDPDALARLVHDIRVAHEADRAAAEGRVLFNLGSWEERAEHQRELDRRIASAVADQALAWYADERREQTLARVSRSVKLARIAALCRAKPDRVCADDVLRIIGDEEAGHD